mgnify:CR=1 FL=1
MNMNATPSPATPGTATANPATAANTGQPAGVHLIREVPALEINGVSWNAGRQRIVHDVSFSVKTGELLGLIGPNGSCKSTLLKTLARLLPPMAGEATVDGQSIYGLSARAFSRKLSLLPQHQLVPEGITVRTLVGYGRSPYLNLWGSLGKADREIVDRVMAATHTDIIADRRVDQLSGGQQQRAFLAMTLAQETPYLLLDEPTTYLDLNHQVALMEMMAQQRDRGATVVAVLHDLNQAARYCDHLIVLKEGELMGEGSPKEVLTAEMLAKVFKVDAAQHVCPESGRPMVVVKDSGLTEQMVTLPDPGWKKEEAA